MYDGTEKLEKIEALRLLCTTTTILKTHGKNAWVHEEWMERTTNWPSP
jgi:hypothetical protein